jgi:xanthine dehydrogenase YagS FAD-binding subunit
VRNFEYLAPKSTSDAVRAGSAPDSRFIAGGTLLVDLMRLGVERPGLVIDLNTSLSSEMKWTNEWLVIGALVKNSDLADDDAVARELPVLSQALLSGASPQIRNMATVGGNLLQRTRCAYFRDPTVAACNKREPGTGCAAIEGHSRMHAILGTSEHCIATHPSDMAVALLALDAHVQTHGPRGERKIALAELWLLPGNTPAQEHNLERGEIITAVLIPRVPAPRRSAYVKVRDRAEFAFALASAAVVLQVNGSHIENARVALGGVGTKPWRVPAVEEALRGRPANAATFEAASKFAARGAKTTRDNAFKTTLAERVVARALAIAMTAEAAPTGATP